MQLGTIFQQKGLQRSPEPGAFGVRRFRISVARRPAAMLVLAASLLAAADCRAGSITLAWNASPEPVTGYTVFYGGQSVLTYPSGAASANAGKVLQYTVSGLTTGQRYYFAVKAYNASGQSGYSNEVSGIVPSPTTTTAPSTSSIRTTTSTSSVRTTTTTSIFSDADRDGIADRYDNCPYSYNPQQLDADGDNLGDVCDTAPGCGGCGQPVCEKYVYASAQASLRAADADGDGIGDTDDNCGDLHNPGQLDANANGVGDCCDPAPECGHTGEPDCDTGCGR